MPRAHSLADQLCIKQCSFRMTWWQYCGFSSRWPLWGAHYLTLGASQPPTLASLGPLISTSPGSLRSWRHPPGARCAPHHCRQYVTFSAGGGGWGRRTKRRREGRNRGGQKEKTSEEIWISTVVDAKTQQAFLKHESPLMVLGDKSYTCRLVVCFCTCVSMSLWVCASKTHVLKTSMSGFVPRTPFQGDLLYLVHLCHRSGGREPPLHLAHLNKYKLRDKKPPLVCMERLWNRGTGERAREMYYEEVSLVSAKSFLGAVTAVIPVQWQALW